MSALDEYKAEAAEYRYSMLAAGSLVRKADAAIAELEALKTLERFQHGVTTCPACHAIMRWEQGEVVEWTATQTKGTK